MSGNRGGVARCLECLAFVRVQEAEAIPDAGRAGYLHHAARKFGAAQATREDSSTPMVADETEEFAQCVSRLRAMMDEEAYETAAAEGRRATVDEVLALTAEADKRN